LSRNPFCPKYEGCLDRAAKKNIDFYCNRCFYRNLREPIPYFEIRPALILLAAIFYPEDFRKYEQERRELPPDKGFSEDQIMGNTILR
jgi:hypothetical protein